MGADEVLRQRLIGDGGLIGGLRQHPGLQGQKIAEDARKGHDHIDTRATQFRKWDQIGTAQATVMVEPRLCPHQRQGLRDRPAI